MKTINLRNAIFASVGILALAAVGLFTGCCKDNPATDSNATALVKIHVSDFTISQDAFYGTKSAEDLADYTNVGAIDLAFYEGTTEVYKTTQLRSDNTTYTTFGEFECNLPIGNYTMVVIGRGYSNGDVFVLTSPTSAGYTSERARETFCATQDVTVTSTTPLDLNVILSRVIAKLHIVSTDNRSASVTKIRTTYSAGGKSFNPTTGLATVNTGFSVTNTPSTAVQTLDVGNYTFLATDEQTMTITIEALDASDNVLFTKVVPNVPLKRNRITTLTGQVFTAGTSSGSFQVETDWLEGNTVEF